MRDSRAELWDGEREERDLSGYLIRRRVFWCTTEIDGAQLGIIIIIGR